MVLPKFLQVVQQYSLATIAFATCTVSVPYNTQIPKLNSGPNTKPNPHNNLGQRERLVSRHVLSQTQQSSANKTILFCLLQFSAIPNPVELEGIANLECLHVTPNKNTTII